MALGKQFALCPDWWSGRRTMLKDFFFQTLTLAAVFWQLKSKHGCVWSPDLFFTLTRTQVPRLIFTVLGICETPPGVDIFLHEKDKRPWGSGSTDRHDWLRATNTQVFSEAFMHVFFHLHVLCFSILNLLARLLSGSSTSKQAGSGPNVWLFDHGATVSGAGESVDEKMEP